MLKIKHTQTKEIKNITVYQWDQNKYNHDTWFLIKEKDIVSIQMWDNINSVWITQNRMEYNDAIKLIKDNPNTYRFLLFENSKRSTIKTIIQAIGIINPGTLWVSISIKNIIKYIIVPIIVGLIITLITLLFSKYY